jgi:hypothetical protein
MKRKKNFNLGDRVVYNGSNLSLKGKPGKVVRTGGSYATVLFDHSKRPQGVFTGNLVEEGTFTASTGITKSEMPSSCEHTWTPYYGLVECYDFCVKCDKKRAKAA